MYPCGRRRAVADGGGRVAAAAKARGLICRHARRNYRRARHNWRRARAAVLSAGAAAATTAASSGAISRFLMEALRLHEVYRSIPSIAAIGSGFLRSPAQFDSMRC